MSHDSVVRKLYVTQIGLDNERNDVFWEFIDPVTYLDYEVWVERSGGVAGPFSVIAKTYGARSYTDRAVRSLSGHPFYYRLRIVRRKDTVSVQTTPVATMGNAPDLIASEIRRRGNLLLREYTGAPVLYYPVRASGQRCPDCWSDLEKHRVKSNCLTCFDTGFLMGYYTPILTYINVHEESNALTQNAEMDDTNQQTALAMVMGELPVQFGDMIVERDNHRWSVSSWEKTEKLRSVVSFRMRLHLLAENSASYKIPLPSGDPFGDAYRNREYTRPYTLNP